MRFRYSCKRTRATQRDLSYSETLGAPSRRRCQRDHCAECSEKRTEQVRAAYLLRSMEILSSDPFIDQRLLAIHASNPIKTSLNSIPQSRPLQQLPLPLPLPLVEQHDCPASVPIGVLHAAKVPLCLHRRFCSANLIAAPPIDVDTLVFTRHRRGGTDPRAARFSSTTIRRRLQPASAKPRHSG